MTADCRRRTRSLRLLRRRAGHDGLLGRLDLSRVLAVLVALALLVVLVVVVVVVALRVAVLRVGHGTLGCSATTGWATTVFSAP